MFKPDHATKVKRLYKLILRTNRGLPPALRTMGDDYTRSEFKRHKGAGQAERYVNSLRRDIKLVPQAKKLPVDKPLNPDMLNYMTDGQLVQLYELHKAAKDVGLLADEGNPTQTQDTTTGDDANTK